LFAAVHVLFPLLVGVPTVLFWTKHYFSSGSVLEDCLVSVEVEFHLSVRIGADEFDRFDGYGDGQLFLGAVTWAGDVGPMVHYYFLCVPACFAHLFCSFVGGCAPSARGSEKPPHHETPTKLS
jgi:hypothetical protein